MPVAGPLQITAALIWIGIFLTLLWKFGGEACQMFVYGSSLVATLIAGLLPDRTPPHPFLPERSSKGVGEM